MTRLIAAGAPANARAILLARVLAHALACAMAFVVVPCMSASAAEAIPAAKPSPNVDQGVGEGQGWTGITNPKGVIHARQELMEHIEILMEPIDTFTVKEGVSPDVMRANASVIGAMLLALPHLFPPTTNLYDPKVEQPKTLALPPIWKNFASFYELAGAAATAADAMEETTSNDRKTLIAASLRLRASCDACHVLFLRKYEPPRVRDSDLNFDFDSALRKK